MAAGPASVEPHTGAVFLNFPYDRQFVPLYLAYITGVCSFGLVPRVALELPGGERRLDRIVELILGCRYSFHDLSRVELDLRRPRTPRMNMPFELGLAVMAAYRSPKQHTWCIFENDYRRGCAASSHTLRRAADEWAGAGGRAQRNPGGAR